jgi:hypothetical protein
MQGAVEVWGAKLGLVGYHAEVHKEDANEDLAFVILSSTASVCHLVEVMHTLGFKLHYHQLFQVTTSCSKSPPAVPSHHQLFQVTGIERLSHARIYRGWTPVGTFVLQQKWFGTQ